MTETSETTSLTFTRPVLTTISGKPDNVTLKSMTKELYTNACSVYSTRGGGTNGHVTIVMPAAAYLTRTGIAFIIPPHPGPNPIFPVNANIAQRAEVNRAYDKDISEFKLYIKVAEELKKQIIAAVDKTYIKILDDREFGYSDVSCLDIITHLQTTYGTIESEDIDPLILQSKICGTSAKKCNSIPKPQDRDMRSTTKRSFTSHFLYLKRRVFSTIPSKRGAPNQKPTIR